MSDFWRGFVDGSVCVAGGLLAVLSIWNAIRVQRLHAVAAASRGVVLRCCTVRPWAFAGVKVPDRLPEDL